MDRGVLRRPVVTYGVVLLCTALMVATTYDETIAFALGMVPGELSAHPWTLLTHVFVHLDWLHLLSNLFYFCVLGVGLEAYLGPKRFSLLLVSGAVVGALAHALLDLSSLVPMVGGSSAVAAVVGAYFAIVPRTKSKEVRKVMTQQVRTALAILALQQLGLYFLPSLHMAWMASLGGLAAGLVFVGLFCPETEDGLADHHEEAVPASFIAL